ncbi:nuclear transport factor 2 family protein [Maritalea mobilis]|uniref:DUF4440 domain-containing protein n=1 Tax=[Roseibacterium] beibuensis TaxID=1193142 RepID=A0ABP9LQW4_9RHOB|nr:MULTISPECIES: nuclear transport factor 2 family protein [Alphaproteobacteria]MBY6200110.1 nuclear transport factor 2 family protein [Maritalea mobilis]MCS6626797.1 nuclear transport factor 2 family protein [Roseibacterium beibuensis]
MDEATKNAIRGAERAVWEALRRGDAAADQAMLSRDFLGVYPDGFAGREAHAEQLSFGPSVLAYEIGEDHVRSLGPGHFLYAYQVRYARPGHTPETMLVSSIWRIENGHLVNIFSQDTPLTGQQVP